MASANIGNIRRRNGDRRWGRSAARIGRLGPSWRGGGAPFALNEALDPAALAGAYRAEGRLQIVDFLRHDGAMALLRALAESEDWRLTANQGEATVDYDPGEIAAWPAERRAALDRQVIGGGRHGFQFRYETIRLPDYGARRGRSGAAAARRASSTSSAREAVIGFMRTLTGAADIGFADGHASRYTRRPFPDRP